MQPLSFSPVSFMASAFTKNSSISVRELLKDDVVSDLLDADPTVFPDKAFEKAPPEFPRAILASKDDHWRLEISRERANLHWSRKINEDAVVTHESFFSTVLSLVPSLTKALPGGVTRLAGVVTSVAEIVHPGRYLAEHFCKPEWLQAPFNRPENFELHAHKAYEIPGIGNCNSWARAKTAIVQSKVQKSAILFEQDINTLPSDERKAEEFIKRFYDALPAEFAGIRKLYFPESEP